ncbi:DUF4251 domain-containing protein [Formosa algae]|uniref:DUF4251 domain-containing protein n=1 Tax=Formosa algae TaxID=225843 RepID=A0A9X0YLL0_9FLAO|nr:DUF4251 domain-containing protein [Formosa algae]MBP1841027.1 hypothetical protein [Formosa algae]MDQ0336553.1 hypothetical protein [Formosa algae]OEI81511.1 hypothetical protein AST99_04535 [Formosa algae]
MKKHVILLIVLVFSINLTFSQTKAEKKALKKEKQEQEFIAIKKLLESSKFTFDADWATTQGGKRISLIGNPNFLKVNDSITEADMPYFGVAQMASYGGDGGITFNGPYKEYSLTYNEKKHRGIVKYAITNDSENFKITLTVYSPDSASLVVYSSNRNSITFDGKVEPLKIKDKGDH